MLVFVALAACSFNPRLADGVTTCGAGDQCPGDLTCQHAAGLPTEGLCCRDQTCGGHLADGGMSGDSGVGGTVGGECDDTSQTSCGIGNACRMACLGTGFGATICGPAGAKPAGDLCGENADCVAGTACIDVECPAGSNVFFCEKYCKVDADCGANGQCTPFLCNGADSVFGVCRSQCDPMASGNGGCAPGLSCVLLSGDVTDCDCLAGGPNHGDGQSCTTLLDCAPGSVCFRHNGALGCRAVCRILGNDCPAGYTCAAGPNFKAYGACVPVGGSSPECDPDLAVSCSSGKTCLAACDAADRAAVLSCQAAGQRTVGQPCRADLDCVPEDTCIGAGCDDGTSMFQCLKRCKVASDCGGGTSDCVRFDCGADPELLGYCTLPCDPRRDGRSGCPAGSACQLFSHDVTDCGCARKAAVATEGQPCDDQIACATGLTCVTDTAQRTCRPICRLDSPQTCMAGRTCRALQDHRLFGACMP